MVDILIEIFIGVTGVFLILMAGLAYYVHKVETGYANRAFFPDDDPELTDDYDFDPNYILHRSNEEWFRYLQEEMRYDPTFDRMHGESIGGW